MGPQVYSYLSSTFHFLNFNKSRKNTGISHRYFRSYIQFFIFIRQNTEEFTKFNSTIGLEHKGTEYTGQGTVNYGTQDRGWEEKRRKTQEKEEYSTVDK